ncbi:MAG: DUF5110 domain-containing protein [Bacteroidales bacterium]|nr:DUF5110 domain-containing protein [Bacteroidales bacterium]
MRKSLATLLALLSLCTLSFAQEEFHPKANPAAIVKYGNARFTVITDRLIRIEWASNGRFEDRATLGAVNRELPVPRFEVKRSKGTLTIATDSLTLTYKGGKPSKDNLKVIFRMGEWYPGKDDSGNLLGTSRTLDGFNGIKQFKHGGLTKDPFDKGVISRDGWALIDESQRHVFVPTSSDWKYWVEARDAKERIDWYLFAYGHSYLDALADFSKLSGRIPLPPKYAFGYWWCRYWMYSDSELVDLAEHFRNLSIPADVMIIDMDWHDTWGRTGRGQGKSLKDEAGEGLGWTGYTWKKELFPNPENLLTELHRHHLKTSLNLHPASGIQIFEEPYERFVKDYLSRTDDYDGPKGFVKADGSPTYVPFRIDQEAWADAYFNSVLHPMEEQGVDFWWLDWQQYPNSRYTKELSNTFWLNHTFWNDVARRGASLGKDAPRPLIYHRWGGIGSHRYQVGFSGDTYATWKVLGYLPYFTATASNIGYAYWGHDIGGHTQPKGVHETDPELYTRWLQEAVFTPIFKTHSTKDYTMEKRFWMFPEHFDAMREAIRLRYDLSPYIYTAARQAYDSGVGICRPLYYYYPEVEEAYSCTEEFLFGDDILATVVCEPVDTVTGLAGRSMWFPSGNDWFDMGTGTLYKGGTKALLNYTVEENPWFVKGGAVIPLAGDGITSLQEADNELRLLVVPGGEHGECVLYEDDGQTQAYTGDYALTTITALHEAEGISVVMSSRKGSYKGMPATRRVKMIFPGAACPSKVVCGGRELPYDRFGGEGSWTYDGDDMQLIVNLGEVSADLPLKVKVQAASPFTGGEKGRMKRLRSIMEEAKLQFALHVDKGKQFTPVLLKFFGTPSFITEDPANAEAYMNALSMDELRSDLDALSLPQDFKTKLLRQLE